MRDTDSWGGEAGVLLDQLRLDADSQHLAGNAVAGDVFPVVLHHAQPKGLRLASSVSSVRSIRRVL